jgi:hypothetical protein
MKTKNLRKDVTIYQKNVHTKIKLSMSSGKNVMMQKKVQNIMSENAMV